MSAPAASRIASEIQLPSAESCARLRPIAASAVPTTRAVIGAIEAFVSSTNSIMAGSGRMSAA